MEKIRFTLSTVILIATIALGSAWLIQPAYAEVEPIIDGQCNCIDGFTRREGVFGWDPSQQRYRCVTGCYVIT